MKFLIPIFLLICYFGGANGQTMQEIAAKPKDQAIAVLAELLDQHAYDQVKLVGLGDVATFASQSQSLHMAAAAYLIQEKGFNKMLVEEDGWKVRSINEYVLSADLLDTLVIDSLIRYELSAPLIRTGEFKEFITWLKKHNLNHPDRMVSVAGVGISALIPIDYLVNTYITPIDYKVTYQLAGKWMNQSISTLQAYQDIKDCLNHLEKTGISPEQNQLINKFKKDILYNDLLYSLGLDKQKTSYTVADFKATRDYTISQILDDPIGKAILYSTNLSVVKGDFRSESITSHPILPTLGKSIHQLIGEEYRCFAADFTDTSELPLVDIHTRQAALEKVLGSEQARQLASKGDIFYLPKDAKALAGYLPASLSFIKGKSNSLLLHNALQPVDAVFLFSKLTHANILSDR